VFGIGITVDKQAAENRSLKAKGKGQKRMTILAKVFVFDFCLLPCDFGLLAFSAT
jgi:hypothetical protein